jgi:hypothetical protein
MRVLIITFIVMLASCATVRQQDLDAWVGVPVEALDTHSIFLTIPMYRTISDSGIEIRNYANSSQLASCFSSAGANVTGNYVNANTFTTCSNGSVTCNNIFYIRDSVVIEYAPTGHCYTNEKAQPQARYIRLNE